MEANPNLLTFRQICRFAFEYLDNSSEEQKYES